ncbi:MAG: hypothetical protein K8T20_11325 [Planctomycetes bacterium]|nr:hypothetical protein [Planctomycetota bacterium]
MIRINLLPAERRKREAGPLPRLGLGAIAGVLLLVAAAAAAWTGSESNKLVREIADRDKELVRERAASSETSRLDSELAPLRRRAEILARVQKVRRVTWSRRLDVVAGILDRETPRVWLTSIRGTDRSGASGDGAEASLELACEASPDPARPAPMGQVTGEFIEALRRAFLAPGGDFTRYDDRYAEKATVRGGTAEGWSNAFVVRLFRDVEKGATR